MKPWCGICAAASPNADHKKQRAYARPPDSPAGGLFFCSSAFGHAQKAQAGEQLCVTSIDRLGRNYEEILEQWRVLTKEKRVDILVLDMPLLDTRRDKNLLGTFIADLVLQVLSFIAQNERESIRTRQAEGIAAARQRGVRFGREIKPLPDNFPENCALWLNGHISGLEAAKRCRMPQSTFYRKAGSLREDSTNVV